MSMEYQLYPRWKYSVTGGVIVDDADAEVGLGEGWYNSPEDVVHAAEDKSAADVAAAEQAAKDLESLRTSATDLGLVVDGRWGIQRLEDEIKAKILAGGDGVAPQPATEA
jgi:hypothetical protein